MISLFCLLWKSWVRQWQGKVSYYIQLTNSWRLESHFVSQLQLVAVNGKKKVVASSSSSTVFIFTIVTLLVLVGSDVLIHGPSKKKIIWKEKSVICVTMSLTLCFNNANWLQANMCDLWIVLKAYKFNSYSGSKWEAKSMKIKSATHRLWSRNKRGSTPSKNACSAVATFSFQLFLLLVTTALYDIFIFTTTPHKQAVPMSFCIFFTVILLLFTCLSFSVSLDIDFCWFFYLHCFNTTPSIQATYDQMRD